MTPRASLSLLLRALTLVVTTFFVLPLATRGRAVELLTGPELRTSSHPISEDTLQSGGRAEAQVFRAPRSDRTPVPSLPITRAGLGLLGTAYEPRAVPRTAGACLPLLLRIRRIL